MCRGTLKASKDHKRVRHESVFDLDHQVKYYEPTPNSEGREFFQKRKTLPTDPRVPRCPVELCVCLRRLSPAISFAACTA